MIPAPPAHLRRSGQVLLVRSTGWLPWIIRRVTGPWNHAALLDAYEPDAPLILEARDLRGLGTSTWPAWVAARTVVALLLLDVPQATDGERLNAMTWAHEQLDRGRPYDTLQLLGIYLRHRIPFLTPTRVLLDSEDRLICSEYAGRAWRHAGRNICPDGVDVSILDPSMLESGGKLRRVCAWSRETGWYIPEGA